MFKPPPPDIAVVAESDAPTVRTAAAELARELELPLRKLQDSLGVGMILAWDGERLELREAHSKPGHGLVVDFSTLNPRQAARRGGFSRRQPLARAIGKTAERVLDATAGLGHDAALLACMGYRVTAVERSNIMATLLRDGLRRALDIDDLRLRLQDHLQIINADARDALRQAKIAFDTVYIDPMFPPKRKASALAKKEIRLVRGIVGDDEDAADLLVVARAHCKRVVVKRPTYAPPLAHKPTSSIAGKLVRYDIYIA